jgi:large subunit ribosomal protein L4
MFNLTDLDLLSIIAIQAGQLIKNTQFQEEALLKSKEAEVARIEKEKITELDEMKTRFLVQALSGLEAKGKVVLVIEESLVDFLRIGKNVKNLKVLHAKDLNVYDVLWCDKLVVTRAELQRVQEVWV